MRATLTSSICALLATACGGAPEEAQVAQPLITDFGEAVAEASFTAPGEAYVVLTDAARQRTLGTMSWSTANQEIQVSIDGALEPPRDEAAAPVLPFASGALYTAWSQAHRSKEWTTLNCGNCTQSGYCYCPLYIPMPCDHTCVAPKP